MSLSSLRAGGLLTAVLLAGVATACTTIPPLPENIPVVSRINKIILIDARTPESKTSRMLSNWVGDCNYGVLSAVEEGFPDKFARLERDLYEALGPKIEGATVTVKKYSTFVNREAEMLTKVEAIAMGGVGVFGGGKPPTNLRPRCTQEKMAGGWFDPADLTNNSSPTTMDITIDVFGKTYSATFAISSGTDLIDTTSEDFPEQQMSKYLHQRLIAKIQSDL